MTDFANSQQLTANSQTVETLKPRKYRKLKLTIYTLALLLIGFFVYSNYIQANPNTLTQPQTAGANQTSPTEGQNSEKSESYWGQSKTIVPTYPPITATTDLPAAAGNIEIPDFSDSTSALKELIAKP